MSTLRFTVDTQPMAEELKSVSHHVNGTTTAVVTMQTALIMAEEEAANKVCRDVNRGFYSLIRSQIAQKIAQLQSNVDSNQMELSQLKNALLNIQSRMHRDYNRISDRYSKLFKGLNSNLKQRVYELDKPTFDFSVKEMEKVANRAKYLTASVPINQLESVTYSQKIIASNVKNHCVRLIDSISSFLDEMKLQRKLTSKILVNIRGKTENSLICIPVLLFECENDHSGKKEIEFFFRNDNLDNESKSLIYNFVYENIITIPWGESQIRSLEIDQEFGILMSASSKSKRVKDYTQKLFQSAEL